MECLALAGDHPFLHQIDDPIREQLGVNPQVFVVRQGTKHGIRDRPDPGLQGGAIRDHGGDVFRDAPGDFRLLGHVDLRKRIRYGHDGGEPGDVDEAIAQGSGHVFIHLGDHDAGGMGRRLGDPHLHPEGAEPMLIRGRDLDQGGIQGKAAAAEQARDLRKEAWGEIRAAFLDRPPDVITDKKGIHTDVPLHPGGDVIRRAHREDLHDLHVLQVGGVFHQGRQQPLGNTTVPGEEDPHPESDVAADRLLSGHQLFPVDLHPRHPRPPEARIFIDGPRLPVPEHGPAPDGPPGPPGC
ncbi:hypothetical protein HRbin22_02625 [Candidatus Thermoflexus japonica]|uniref:Uncharacterized protein n=1 Tax=Candidatus Thermoflexus japonica TaxID=2035417 RepID=A0A2H5YAB0_9CHLR|nr:hypothetical protein HRbin22_02625 [Candidatus Thermoflexus japonica]